MPAHVAHALAGTRCVNSVPGLEILSDSAEFLLGCQGPDVFSHNRRTKPLALAYGRLLHRREYGTFCARFADILRSEGRGSLDSPSAEWLYGFVTHQAIDRALHPYIVYRSFYPGDTGVEGVTGARMHAFLERILDAELYRALERKPVSAFDSNALHPERDVAPLARDVARALASTYPGESEGSRDLELRVANAFADTLRYYDMTNPSRVTMGSPPDPEIADEFSRFSHDGVALLHPERVDDGVDWLNDARETWLEPVTGVERRESVLELFEAAVAAGAAAASALLRALDGTLGPADFARAIGNGSLSATDFDGSAAPVRFSSPFDLARYLRIEAERRGAWLSARARLTPPGAADMIGS